MDFEWLRPKIRYIVIVIIILIVGFLVYQYRECNKKGKALGGAYKCDFFSSKPVPVLPLDEYYDISNGDCYHYIDFGSSMSIKKVSIDKCS